MLHTPAERIRRSCLIEWARTGRRKEVRCPYCVGDGDFRVMLQTATEIGSCVNIADI